MNPWEKGYRVAQSSGERNPWEKGYVSRSFGGARDELLARRYSPDQLDAIESEMRAMDRSDAYRGDVATTDGGADRWFTAVKLAEGRDWKLNPEGEKGSRAESAWRGAGQLGMYWTDELSGVAGGLVDKATGGSFKDGYRRTTDYARAQDRLAKYDNPAYYTAGEVVGGVATGFVPAAKLPGLNTAFQGARNTTNTASQLARGGRPIRAGGSVAGRGLSDVLKTAGSGAAGGAVFGGIAGAGIAEGGLEERVAGATTGATVGAGAGAVLAPVLRYSVGPLAGAASRKFGTSAENKALDAVIKRMRRSGRTFDDVRGQFDQWRQTGEVPETLAEMLGPDERQLLSAVITSNKGVRESAEEVFSGRGQQELDWLEDRIGAAFGKDRTSYGTARAAANQARSADAAPYYDGAFYVGGNPGTGRIMMNQAQQADFDTIMMNDPDALQFLAGAERELRRAVGRRTGDYGAADEVKAYVEAIKKGKKPPRLSVQSADYVQRQVGNFAQEAAQPGATNFGHASGLIGLQDDLRGVIDTDALTAARSTHQAAIRQGELLQEGVDMFSPRVQPEDIAEGLAEANDEGVAAFGAGAARAVSNKLRRQSDMRGFADKSRAIARNRDYRDKLDAARPKRLKKDGTPDNRYKQSRLNAAMDEGLERVSNRANTAVDMVGNSKTAFRLGDVADAEIEDAMMSQIGDVVSDAISGGPIAAANAAKNRWGQTVGSYIGRPSLYNPRFANTVGDTLLAQGDDAMTALARLEARANRVGNRRVLPLLPQRVGAQSSGALQGKEAALNDPRTQDWEFAVVGDIQAGIEKPVMADALSGNLDEARLQVLMEDMQQRLESPSVSPEDKELIREFMRRLQSPESQATAQASDE